MSEAVVHPVPEDWAKHALVDAAGYADKFGGVRRPAYSLWITYDILGVGISAALAQGLRLMAHANP